MILHKDIDLNYYLNYCTTLMFYRTLKVLGLREADYTPNIVDFARRWPNDG